MISQGATHWEAMYKQLEKSDIKSGRTQQEGALEVAQLRAALEEMSAREARLGEELGRAIRSATHWEHKHDEMARTSPHLMPANASLVDGARSGEADALVEDAVGSRDAPSPKGSKEATLEAEVANTMAALKEVRACCAMER
jgi:hypothetical protein